MILFLNFKSFCLHLYSLRRLHIQTLSASSKSNSVSAMENTHSLFSNDNSRSKSVNSKLKSERDSRAVESDAGISSVSVPIDVDIYNTAFPSDSQVGFNSALNSDLKFLQKCNPRKINDQRDSVINVNEQQDTNRNTLTLYDCLHPIFILGRILCVLPFTVEKFVEESEENVIDPFRSSANSILNLYSNFNLGRKMERPGPRPKFSMTTSKHSIIRSIFIKTCVTVHLTVLVINEKDRLRDVEIMTWLWRLTLALFCTYVITILWTLQFQRNKWISVFDKSVEIHEQFRKLGFTLSVNYLPKIFVVICIFHFFLGLPHILYARALDEKIVKFSNIIAKSTSTGANHTFLLTLQIGWLILEVLLDYIAWTAFHFADTLRIALAVYCWILFSRFNRGLEQLCFDAGRLNEVMSLHMRLSNLVGMINSLISPLTFVGCIFFVFYACFYVNYVMWGLATKIRLMLFVHFIVKNLIIFLVSADVTAKAHAVSEWLERISTTEETIPLQSEKLNKLIIFTAQVYHRDSIGFKGLQFFTISTSFFAAVVSLIATYTVVITQIAESPFNQTKILRPGNE